MNRIKILVKKSMYLFQKTFRHLKLIKSVRLQTDGIDEAVLSEEFKKYNKSAEDYFVHHKEHLINELQKPFILVDNMPSQVLKLSYVLSELKLNQNMTVVDFGCGTGWLSFYFNMLGLNVFGIDVSETVLDFAREHIVKNRYYNNSYFFHFLKYNGEKLPLSDCSVHYIVTFDAFHHVPNMEEVLHEMHRVLIPGGKVIMSEPGTGHSLSKQTIEEVHKFGVLERDVNILDMEKRSSSAGFKKMFLKPILADMSFRLDKAEYTKILEGFTNIDLLYNIQNSFISNPFIILEKEGSISDPYYHTADLKSGDSKKAVHAGDTFNVKFSVKNTGPVSYLSIPHDNGGFVTIGAQLKKDGQIIDQNYSGRIILDSDMIPGEEREFNFELKAPENKGKYTLLISPVVEKRYWFSDAGTKPLEIELIVQ